MYSFHRLVHRGTSVTEPELSISADRLQQSTSEFGRPTYEPTDYLASLIQKYVYCNNFVFIFLCLFRIWMRMKMFPSNQSGFRRNHSTETILLRLLSDFYSAMDRGHVTLLALFDVSSAFDSVDHSILLQRLTTSFGLVDQPLAWLKSFLSDRSSCVVIGPSRSF